MNEKKHELEDDLWNLILRCGKWRELTKPEQQAISNTNAELAKRVDKDDNSWTARMIRGSVEADRKRGLQ